MDSFAKAFLAFLTRKQRIEEMHRTYERIARAKMSLENRINQVVGFFKDRKNLWISYSEWSKDINYQFVPFAYENGKNLWFLRCYGKWKRL